MNALRSTKALIAVILILLGGNCRAANFSWVTSGGNWNTASNWRDGNGNPGVPGTNDSAVIGTEEHGGISGGVTVDTQAIVGSLSVFNTTITISSLSPSNDLGVVGIANIEVSTLSGGVFNFSGPLNFDGPPEDSNIAAVDTISGGALVQCNSLTIVSSSTQLCVASSILFNSGTMGVGFGDVISTTTDPDATGPGGQVENKGLFLTGGNVTVTRNLHFFNDGQVTVNGTLGFNGAGTTVVSNSNSPIMSPHGEFDTSGPGSRIEIDCPASFLDGTGFGGNQGGTLLDGINQFSTTGTVTVGGTAPGSGPASLAFGPDSAGGTGTLLLHGNLDVLAGDTFTWSAGTIKASATTLGAITMERGGTMQMPLSGTNSLLNVTLDTKPAASGSAGGTIAWSGTATLLTGSSAIIQNDGLFQDTGAGTFASANFDSGSISNTGTFAVASSTSAAVTTIAIPFSSFGATNCTSGTLKFTGGSGGEIQGGNTNSTMFLQGTGVIDFNGGTFDIVGGTNGAFLNVTGNGKMIVDGTATLLFSNNGAIQFSNPNSDPTLELDANGTIGGNGNLQLGAPSSVIIGAVFNWTGGTLSGSGTTSIGFGCTLAISGTSDKTISGGRQLLNGAGVSTWQDSGRIVCGDGVLIDNQKNTSIDIFNDSGIVVTSTGGAPPLFRNEGIIDKKSGTGTTLFGLNVLNLGSIEVDVGTIEYGGTYADIQPVSGNLVQANEVTPLDSTTATGTVLLESGSAQFDNATTIVGSLAGAGTVIAPAGITNEGFWLTGKLKLIGNLTNEGDIQIGFLPEALTITGNFTQTSAGDLVIPIDGTNPAFSEIALLKVSGAAMLGGTFQAAFEDGFSPKVGETFGFLTAGSIVGQFNPIQVPNGAGTLKGSGHSLTLTVTHLNPSPVAAVAGRYDGLIRDTATPADATTGFITLQLTPSAAFTSSLKYGGKVYALKGSFQTTGTFTGLIAHTSLFVTMGVDIANGTDTLTGTIEDLSTNVTSDIAANRAVFNSKTKPAPQKGHYTVILGLPSDSANPQGFGYGTASVDGNGMLKFAGKLGDGTAISQSVPISKDGLWPFFAMPYKTGGSISGAVTFEEVTNRSDLDGLINWFKEPVVKPPKNGLYPAGFSAQISLAGSTYAAPMKMTAALLLPSTSNNATITLSDGGLASAPASVTATIGSNNKVVVANPSQFKMSISTGSGLFTGSFLDSGKTYHFAGALYQKADPDGFGHAQGEFTGLDATGSIDLEANP